MTASGNEGADACDTSPGSAGLNINVGAHSEPIWLPKVGCKNPIEAFSNWGSCVDVIAPGRDIVSVDYRSIDGNYVKHKLRRKVDMLCVLCEIWHFAECLGNLQIVQNFSNALFRIVPRTDRYFSITSISGVRLLAT